METTKRPWTDDWMQELGRMDTAECHSGMRNEEIPPLVTAQMDPEIIMPSESVRKRQGPDDVAHVWDVKTDSMYELDKPAKTQTGERWSSEGECVGCSPRG